MRQLRIYSDEMLGHDLGFVMQARVFRQVPITAADVGKTFSFRFDVKRDDLALNSRAAAYLQILDGTDFSVLDHQ